MLRPLSDPTPSVLISAAVFATVTTILPGFLVGALSVQVANEFAVSEATYGWGLGGFFLSATLGSKVLGGVAQRIGPRRQVVASLAASVVAQLFIAALASSFWLFVGALAVTGLANSANQSAINLLLSTAKLPRLGLAIALKQSGMPTASLLGGLAVPAIALTVGWRWAYVIGAISATLAALNILRVVQPVGAMERGAVPKPLTDRRTLVMASVGLGCMAFAAGALNAWIVGSGVDAGISEARAGLLLSLGAGFGIAVRLLIGVQIDQIATRPFRLAGIFSMVGALGIALLAISTPLVAVLATILAFGAGWVWPVFTNFGIVNANREAAAAASGITQTGVYIGVFAGPLLSGILIEAVGYSVMWLVTAVVMVAGASISMAIAPSMVASSEPGNV